MTLKTAMINAGKAARRMAGQIGDLTRLPARYPRPFVESLQADCRISEVEASAMLTATEADTSPDVPWWADQALKRFLEGRPG
jgi:hypothetical protein